MGMTPLTSHQHSVRVPISNEAQAALEQWLAAHLDDIDTVLAPHGIRGEHLIRHHWERAVCVEQLPAIPAYGSTRAPLPADQRRVALNCTGLNWAGGMPCGRRTRHPSGRCPAHRDQT